MGPLEQIQQVATATVATTSETFTLLMAVLGALFALSAGGYVYTWKTTSYLRTLILNHLEHRIKKLEKRIAELEE